jgi:uncharacterized protein (DUF305 family)
VTRPGQAPVAVVVGAATAVLALGLAGGVSLAPLVTGAPPSAGAQPGVVDIGFSQDMIVHHEQAVLTAQLVLGRTADPTVAALAAGVHNAQLLEIGQLRGYLTLWDAPALPAGPPMTWMAHGETGHADHQPGTAAMMPGMATQDELDALRRATGTQLDVMFLQLMLRHHDGGMPMLEDAAGHAVLPAVRNLANQMAYHQAEETATLLQLLAARGAQPLVP